jgi:hypothetical protein
MHLQFIGKTVSYIIPFRKRRKKKQFTIEKMAIFPHISAFPIAKIT